MVFSLVVPVILNQLDDIIADIGQSVEFTVFIKKTHIPVTFQCFKDKENIKIDSQKYQLEHDSDKYSYKFIINNISLDDASIFNFVVANIFGQSSVSGSLLIKSI
jgi:hypothetical protein